MSSSPTSRPVPATMPCKSSNRCANKSARVIRLPKSSAAPRNWSAVCMLTSTGPRCGKSREEDREEDREDEEYRSRHRH